MQEQRIKAALRLDRIMRPNVSGAASIGAAASTLTALGAAGLSPQPIATIPVAAAGILLIYGLDARTQKVRPLYAGERTPAWPAFLSVMVAAFTPLLAAVAHERRDAAGVFVAAGSITLAWNGLLALARRTIWRDDDRTTRTLIRRLLARAAAGQGDLHTLLWLERLACDWQRGVAPDGDERLRRSAYLQLRDAKAQDETLRLLLHRLWLQLGDDSPLRCCIPHRLYQKNGSVRLHQQMLELPENRTLLRLFDRHLAMEKPEPDPVGQLRRLLLRIVQGPHRLSEETARAFELRQEWRRTQQQLQQLEEILSDPKRRRILAALAGNWEQNADDLLKVTAELLA